MDGLILCFGGRAGKAGSMKTVKEIARSKAATYYYRGLVERLDVSRSKNAYRWVDGWSRNSDAGGIEYPWISKQEARSVDPGCVFVRVDA